MTEYKKRVRIVGDARQQAIAEIKSRYEQQMPIRAIATEIGRSYGFVHRCLDEAGVPMRPRGGAHPARPKGRRRSDPAPV
jgi:hypothetical protein